MKLTNYVTRDFGGDYYSNGWCKLFKRNKRDITKEITIDGTTFILKEAFGYNKALVYVDKNDQLHEILVSYTTIVVEKTSEKIEIGGWYSRTTAQHINTYLYPITRKGYCKKDLEKEPTIYFE